MFSEIDSIFVWRFFQRPVYPISLVPDISVIEIVLSGNPVTPYAHHLMGIKSRCDLSLPLRLLSTGEYVDATADFLPMCG